MTTTLKFIDVLNLILGQTLLSNLTTVDLSLFREHILMEQPKPTQFLTQRKQSPFQLLANIKKMFVTIFEMTIKKDPLGSFLFVNTITTQMSVFFKQATART